MAGLSLILATLSMASVIYDRWSYRVHDCESGVPAAESVALHSAASLRRPSGPWGSLEAVHITIERPDEFLTLNRPLRDQSRWFFKGYSCEQLSNLWTVSELTPRQRTALLDSTRWQSTSNGIYVVPDRDLILGLGKQARQGIYSILAQSPENYFQHLAFKYRGDGFDEWFEKGGLSPQTLELVKRLLYQRGTALCFSDLPEALSCLSSAEEQRRLVKTLSRQSTLLVNLKINSNTDVEALVRYWGKEGHAKDIKPLLQSLVKVGRETSIDVAHLLPPFARMRLYTYPFPSEDPVAGKRDCFWTAMNFFNEEPEDRFCDFEYTKRAIHSEYYPIQDDPSYGDIIWLIDSNGRAVHSAVFIADDIVFTKNGAHFSQPWVLSHFDDMLALFSSDKPLRVVAYRLKNT